MSDIDHLRERVEAAEQRFGVITEQQNNYSQRIIELMNNLETDVGKFRDESKKHEKEIERLHFENEQLRGMLHSLLLSVESDSFVETMRDLDDKVSVLLSGQPLTPETEQDAGEAGDCPAAPPPSAISCRSWKNIIFCRPFFS